MMDALTGVLAAPAALASAVLVHEASHAVVARCFGLGVKLHAGETRVFFAPPPPWPWGT